MVDEGRSLSDQGRPGREAPPVLSQTDDVEACGQVAPVAQRHRVPARTQSIHTALLQLPAAVFAGRRARCRGSVWPALGRARGTRGAPPSPAPPGQRRSCPPCPSAWPGRGRCAAQRGGVDAARAEARLDLAGHEGLHVGGRKPVEADAPTPRAGYWHVWMRGPQSAATEEPLPGDLIPELLEE